jgi:hypothetical protein
MPGIVDRVILYNEYSNTKFKFVERNDNMLHLDSDCV